jgi:hypothetical protein
VESLRHAQNTNASTPTEAAPKKATSTTIAIRRSDRGPPKKEIESVMVLTVRAKVCLSLLKRCSQPAQG